MTSFNWTEDDAQRELQEHLELNLDESLSNIGQYGVSPC